ncbi:MAG TPA: PspA/IM30 family protein [Acidimicrobiales bacterium]|nr:PspA/IM30 family protein [Acidimicrobiales bacterium]
MGIISSIRQRIRYFTARSDARFNERADPKVQLEQAIGEAQDQHRRLKEQAANVIANQKQAELRLNREMAEYEKLTSNTRQAVLLAEESAKAGDAAKAADYTAAAEEFAGRLITMEHDIEDTKSLVLQSSQAAEQAKAAVAQNAQALQAKLAERQKLLSQLDQAKMQEQMNAAMSSLGEAVGEDVPSFDEIRDKIEARYAKAKGLAELNTSTVSDRMFEIERQSMNSEAQERLSEIRSQLGLGAGATPTGEIGDGGAGTATTASAAAPAEQPAGQPAEQTEEA